MVNIKYPTKTFDCISIEHSKQDIVVKSSNWAKTCFGLVYICYNLPVTRVSMSSIVCLKGIDMDI